MYWSLFWTFAKVGVMTFGGGYAMLPILEREVVDNKKWVDDAEIMDYYAISQCTPGVIIVNVATFIGEKLGGRWGGIIATLGVIRVHRRLQPHEIVSPHGVVPRT